jgi:hypothetical protein
MVHKDITPDMFKDIDFPQRDIPDINVSKYRVYTDHNHFTLVAADSAQTAIELSGVKNPVRVLRDSIHLQNVMVLAGITAKASVEQDNKPKPEPLMVPQGTKITEVAAETTETPQEAPSEATASAEDATKEPETALSEAALSSEEVDKLLTPDS